MGMMIRFIGIIILSLCAGMAIQLYISGDTYTDYVEWRLITKWNSKARLVTVRPPNGQTIICIDEVCHTAIRWKEIHLAN